MSYSVCILAAGRGLRLGRLTGCLNKALLPLGNKAVISRIIELFPSDVTIVVALGYEGEKVEEYLMHAHPGRKIMCVTVDNYDGPGSGPGYSLLCCKQLLQQPFVVCAADTLPPKGYVVPPPDVNWFGVGAVDDTSRFCSVQITNGMITRIDDKVKTSNKYAFIGLAGIHDAGVFWQTLENDASLVAGEVQLSNGFAGLISVGLHPEDYTGWHDTGLPETYAATRSKFEPEGAYNFDKINEFVYFVGSRVIKYFEDETIVGRRVRRAELLKGLCPKIVSGGRWFYSYEFVKGQTLYACLDAGLAHSFFEWCDANVWKKLELSQSQSAAFIKAAHEFYHDKTLSRLAKLKEKLPDICHDDALDVNGTKVKSLNELIRDVPWQLLCQDAVPVNFHGDLQFDNVIHAGWSADKRDDFKLLDWRDSFAGELIGDAYYDFAKLLGGMTVSYGAIKKGLFSYSEDEQGVHFDYQLSHSLMIARESFLGFLDTKWYDVNRVRILMALIFLNMSPLHNAPFDRMLYHMGRFCLQDALR